MSNLLEKLGPAALRRFDWKVAFQALSAPQRWVFFLQQYHLLGGDIASAQPLWAAVDQQLVGLTPGDVAPVIRQFRQLQHLPPAQQWFERLRVELAACTGAAAAAPHNSHVAPTLKNSAPLAV